jgi:hypothetical protein
VKGILEQRMEATLRNTLRDILESNTPLNDSSSFSKATQKLVSALKSVDCRSIGGGSTIESICKVLLLENFANLISQWPKTPEPSLLTSDSDDGMQSFSETTSRLTSSYNTFLLVLQLCPQAASAIDQHDHCLLQLILDKYNSATVDDSSYYCDDFYRVLCQLSRLVFVSFPDNACRVEHTRLGCLNAFQMLIQNASSQFLDADLAIMMLTHFPSLSR